MDCAVDLIFAIAVDIAEVADASSKLSISSVLAFTRSSFSTKSPPMYPYVSVLVCFVFSLFTPSSARVPDYATRVRSEYRFPIPYPIPTGPWHEAASSSTPTSVSQDWSTPSDYSYWIIQTDNYRPSITGLVEASSGPMLLNSLHITMSNDRDAASSTSTESEPMKTDVGQMSAESITEDIPHKPTVASKPSLSSTASARVSQTSSGGARSQISVAIMAIWFVATGNLMSQL